MDNTENPHPGRKPAARSLRRACTDAERALWLCLRDRRLDGYKFRRQHPIGPYFADFACVEAGLVIELDGGQHGCPGNSAYDEHRTNAMVSAGFHVLRFTNGEALRQRDAVLAGILRWLMVHA